MIFLFGLMPTLELIIRPVINKRHFHWGNKVEIEFTKGNATKSHAVFMALNHHPYLPSSILTNLFFGFNAFAHSNFQGL
jgi:hypothetical protein